MNMTKMVLLIAIFISGAATAAAQGTSLDLRTDGRILTGSRKDYFLRQVKTSQIQVSDTLRNKLGNTHISAIVVPTNKIGDKYLIGVVIGTATLPDDWPVNEQDFRTVRDYSVNKALSSVETKYSEIRLSVGLGIDAQVVSFTAALRLVIGASGEDGEVASSYAGYLLQDLDSSPQMSKFSDFVIKYRVQEGRALDRLLKLYFDRGASNQREEAANANPLTPNRHLPRTPFRVSESDDVLKLRDLNAVQVERQGDLSGVEAGYLKVWYGRNVIIVPEKPGAPFSAQKYKGGFAEYFRMNGSSMNADAAVRAVMIPKDQDN